MSPAETSKSPVVVLAEVNDVVLEELLAVALAEAQADEVTPPLGSTPGWNPQRIAWFRAFHRSAVPGLDGPAHEKTWAVMADGVVAGSVRLKWVGPGVVETGIWMGRTFRGHGLGRLALQHVTAKAKAYGATVLEASTIAENQAAQSLLVALGAELQRDGTQVTARLLL